MLSASLLRRAPGWLTLGCWVLTGCSAKIHALRAEPNVICQGTTARLSWDASGKGALSAQPADPSLPAAAVAKRGALTVRPSATTLYRLTLSEKQARDTTVWVRTASSTPQPLAGTIADPSVTCDGQRLGLTVDAPAESWDPFLTIDEVRKVGDRPMRVEHDGRTAELATEGASHAFRGARAQGRWALSVPLRPGEACADPSLPNSLAISIQTTCPASTEAPR